ncbi:MAG: tetratricopeptide repeat protein [Magnetococcales bacterium]|nr:tetratricopeptide repeat protein [Magnetococcales bacterium]
MNTQHHGSVTSRTTSPGGFWNGLTSMWSRHQPTPEESTDWNHWVFLQIHNYEVRIAGPGVPTTPRELENWQPLLEEIATLEFRPISPKHPVTPNPENGVRLQLGMHALMDKLGPILASDQIRWIPPLDQTRPSEVNELLAKRFVAEKVIQDYDLTERLYRQILAMEPTNADILGGFALFMHEVRHDAGQADSLYRRALQANPHDAANLENFAIFLHQVRHAYDEAETCYRRSLELEPAQSIHASNLALFLHEVRNDDDQAEQLFRQAMSGTPDAATVSNFALFLHNTRRDDDLAETLYRRAIALDSQDANCLGNFALFLKNVRHDHDGAEHHFRLALTIEPNHSAHLGNFALFLKNVRQDYDGAETYYHRALQADPNDSNHLGNLAHFMRSLRRNPEAAEELYRRSLQVEPNNIVRLGNFVQLLLCNGREVEGLPLLHKALMQLDNAPPDLKLELWFYVLAHDLPRFDEALHHIKGMILAGIRSPGWDLQCNCQRALQNHHPEAELIQSLAEVISGSAPVTPLNHFAAWKRA